MQHAHAYTYAPKACSSPFIQLRNAGILQLNQFPPSSALLGYRGAHYVLVAVSKYCFRHTEPRAIAICRHEFVESHVFLDVKKNNTTVCAENFQVDVFGPLRIQFDMLSFIGHRCLDRLTIWNVSCFFACSL